MIFLQSLSIEFKFCRCRRLAFQVFGVDKLSCVLRSITSTDIARVYPFLSLESLEVNKKNLNFKDILCLTGIELKSPFVEFRQPNIRFCTCVELSYKAYSTTIPTQCLANWLKTKYGNTTDIDAAFSQRPMEDFSLNLRGTYEIYIMKGQRDRGWPTAKNNPSVASTENSEWAQLQMKLYFREGLETSYWLHSVVWFAYVFKI